MRLVAGYHEVVTDPIGHKPSNLGANRHLGSEQSPHTPFWVRVPCPLPSGSKWARWPDRSTTASQLDSDQINSRSHARLSFLISQTPYTAQYPNCASVPTEIVQTYRRGRFRVKCHTCWIVNV